VDAIVPNIIADLLWAAIGGAVYWLGRQVFLSSPTRRLWRLAAPDDLSICASTSTTTDTGEYHRPATGIGQLRAAVLVVTSLNRAYRRDLHVKNVLLSEEPLQNRLENDLILLGGPKNNRISRLLLDKLAERLIVDQQGSEIIALVPGQERRFTSATEQQRVKKDHGLIIRMNNVFALETPTTVCLFSGGHTYGTIAATRYFTENLYRKVRKFQSLPRNFVMVVSCDVVEGYPANICLEWEHSFRLGD
jgi:hypothetical protein